MKSNRIIVIVILCITGCVLGSMKIISSAGYYCTKDNIVTCCDYGAGQHDCCDQGTPPLSDCAGLVSNHFSIDYNDAGDPVFWAEDSRVTRVGEGYPLGAGAANISIDYWHIVIVEYNPSYPGGGWIYWECGGPRRPWDCAMDTTDFTVFSTTELYYIE